DLRDAGEIPDGIELDVLVEGAGDGVSVEVRRGGEPSGALLATLVTPGRPGRVSATARCLPDSANLSAIHAAKPSAMLPGETGTTMRAVWFGYCAASLCADAIELAASKAVIAAAALTNIMNA